MIELVNSNGRKVNAPLAHVLHRGSSETVYTELFESVNSLFKSVTGQEISIDLFISDGELSLKNAADNIFKPQKNLPCCFHQSKSLREQFCQDFKKELDDEIMNDIKRIFHTIKWLLLCDKSISLEILQLLKLKIKKSRFRSQKLTLKATRTRLLDIFKYLEKKIERENKYTAPWLLEIEETDFILDRSNNSIESNNSIIQSKLKKCCGTSTMKKLLHHKKTSFNMNSVFHSEFAQKTKNRISHKKATIFNYETLIKISEAQKNKFDATQMLTLLSQGHF